MTPQEKYSKEKMAAINMRYKKEFVQEFKDACAYLGLSQSEVFRNAMNETIEKVSIDDGSYLIDQLRSNEKLFYKFIQELKDADEFKKFQGYFEDYDALKARIDAIGKENIELSDKELHDYLECGFESEIEEYSKIELSNGKNLQLYHKHIRANWDDKAQIYLDHTYSDYYKLKIE